MLVVSKALSLPLKELDFSFAKASGPGGQKVNKTNSCAILTWNLRASRSLSENQRSRLEQKLKHRISVRGEISVRSTRFRDQGKNVADCMEKLSELLAKALAVPKKRVPTKPTRASQRERVESKRRASEKKQLRCKVRY